MPLVVTSTGVRSPNAMRETRAGELSTRVPTQGASASSLTTTYSEAGCESRSRSRSVAATATRRHEGRLINTAAVDVMRSTSITTTVPRRCEDSSAGRRRWTCITPGLRERS